MWGCDLKGRPTAYLRGRDGRPRPEPRRHRAAGRAGDARPARRADEGLPHLRRTNSSRLLKTQVATLAHRPRRPRRRGRRVGVADRPPHLAADRPGRRRVRRVRQPGSQDRRHDGRSVTARPDPAFTGFHKVEFDLWTKGGLRPRGDRHGDAEPGSRSAGQAADRGVVPGIDRRRQRRCRFAATRSSRTRCATRSAATTTTAAAPAWRRCAPTSRCTRELLGLLAPLIAPRRLISRRGPRASLRRVVTAVEVEPNERQLARGRDAVDPAARADRRRRRIGAGRLAPVPDLLAIGES